MYVQWFGITDFLKVDHEEKGELLHPFLVHVKKSSNVIGFKRKKESIVDSLITDTCCMTVHVQVIII